ncbi:DNA (cytosine-5-)-methyltransferase [Cytobacillus horneckiae]|uniref:DNA cytosine methyltransferase n=1 Tax=Cytobacillus horneckiae TaxID=549687 RepID=UPI0034CFC065
MKSIELFAGIGGIALAAEWAGIETVGFCEREPFCQQVLNKHWPSVPIFDDVCTLNKQALEERGIDVGAIDIISGGFPCQPYSVAGKRKGTEDDRDLWPEMFRIIEEIRPTWIVGENVANFANMELDRTLSDLESINYKGRAFILPAASVQAPHERMRTFIVAHTDSIGRDNRSDNWKERHLQIEQHRDDKESQSEWERWFDRVGTLRTVLPNSISFGLQKERAKFKATGFAGNSENVSNSNCQGLERSKDTGKTSRGRKNSDEQFTGYDQSRNNWAAEPNVGRVANGVPNRVDRIKGLGNAVVPQQIYPIFKYIKQIHDMETQE